MLIFLINICMRYHFLLINLAIIIITNIEKIIKGRIITYLLKWVVISILLPERGGSFTIILSFTQIDVSYFNIKRNILVH
jgi:hypothetical protein